MRTIISCIISLSLCSLVWSSCTFPSGFRGTWESPGKGTVVINDTYITGYEIWTYTGQTFACEVSSGSQYVIRSDNFTILGGNVVEAAVCLQITQVSANKYTYFIMTEVLADANDERVMFISASTPTLTIADVCNDTIVDNTPIETKLLLRSGTETSSAVQCPNDLLGKFTYYNQSTCANSNWDGCTSITAIDFNYATMCNETQAFSTNGTVLCVLNVDNGGSSVTYVYNEDITVDGSTNYRFSCFVTEKTSGIVYVSQSEEECHANQTATYVLSPGHTIKLEATITCIPTDDDVTATSNAGLVAGLVVVFLVLIIAGALVGFWFYKKKCNKVEPKEKRIIDKDEKKQPINDLQGKATPSQITPEMNSARNDVSHGKLTQMLGPEYTMTSKEGGAQATDLNLQDVETPRAPHLPPITTGDTPRDALSPLDTQLRRPTLPNIQ